jgi:prolyl oligopeptidase PreP (S9A serine peptidase family)
MADPVREVLHGIEVEDPFRWLEDQDSPETRLFIQAEQKTYLEYLDCHKELCFGDAYRAIRRSSGIGSSRRASLSEA